MKFFASPVIYFIMAVEKCQNTYSCDVTEWLKRKNKKKRKHKLIKIFVGVAFLIALLVGYYFISVVPMIRRIGKDSMQGVAQRALGAAVIDSVTLSLSYNDLVETVTDSDGNVQMLRVNTPLVSVITRTTVFAVEQYFLELESISVPVPFGAFTGVPFFATRGAKINISAMPIAVIVGDFSSEIHSAGINQSLHRLSLNLQATVMVILAGARSEAVATLNLPLVEHVIVGRVPQILFRQ
ncbi:MAG: sporulation protein YunB [Firmicutes bacterium]|nr:sporulation protein YunB [Bacillota bacterium]